VLQRGNGCICDFKINIKRGIRILSFDFPSYDSTGTGKQWIYYKFSAGTESGTITVSISGNTNKMARMYAFRNVAPSSFNEGGQFGSGSSSTISAQQVTTTGNGRLTVSFVFVNGNNAVDSFTGESGGNWQEATSEFYFVCRFWWLHTAANCNDGFCWNNFWRKLRNECIQFLGRKAVCPISLKAHASHHGFGHFSISLSTNPNKCVTEVTP
jgi:hypothetical protein